MSPPHSTHLRFVVVFVSSETSRITVSDQNGRRLLLRNVRPSVRVQRLQSLRKGLRLRFRSIATIAASLRAAPRRAVCRHCQQINNAERRWGGGRILVARSFVRSVRPSVHLGRIAPPSLPPSMHHPLAADQIQEKCATIDVRMK